MVHTLSHTIIQNCNFQNSIFAVAARYLVSAASSSGEALSRSSPPSVNCDVRFRVQFAIFVQQHMGACNMH